MPHWAIDVHSVKRDQSGFARHPRGARFGAREVDETLPSADDVAHFHHAASGERAVGCARRDMPCACEGAMALRRTSGVTWI